MKITIFNGLHSDVSWPILDSVFESREIYNPVFQEFADFHKMIFDVVFTGCVYIKFQKSIIHKGKPTAGQKNGPQKL